MLYIFFSVFIGTLSFSNIIILRIKRYGKKPSFKHRVRSERTSGFLSDIQVSEVTRLPEKKYKKWKNPQN